MRRSTGFGLFLLLLCAISCFSQTPTPIPITGNVQGITAGATPYAGVSIQLVNCPAPISIPGTTVIAPQGQQLQADGTGLINSTIWPNDKIDCNGTTGNSQYTLQYIVNGTPTADPACYQVLSTQGTWNLNTQQPQICTQTPPNPGDVTFNNIVGTVSVSGGQGIFSALKILGLAGHSGDMLVLNADGSITHIPAIAAGVSSIIPGANVTCSVNVSGKCVGDVTVNSTATGGGGVNTGATGQVAYYTDPTHVGGVNFLPIAQGGTNATSAASALQNLGGLPDTGVNGIVYRSGSFPTMTRGATGTDITGLLGYTPLIPSNNLSELTNDFTALHNLFLGASMVNSPMVGVDSSGNPLAVQIGQGLTYTPAAGSGSVVALSITAAGNYPGGACPSITFSGGGGSGAAGFLTCTRIPGPGGGGISFVTGYVITNTGSGYTSAPTVVLTGSGGGAVTAVLGGATLLQIAEFSVGPIGGSPLAAGACVSGSATAAGVVAGRPTAKGISGGTMLGPTFAAEAQTGSGTVVVQICNITAGTLTPPSTTFNVAVF